MARASTAVLDPVEAVHAEVMAQGVAERPATPELLWKWCEGFLGLHVPRVPVCPGHHAPFDFLWAAYAELVTEALVIANRGGGKTWLFAALHQLNSRFKAGCGTFHVGAAEFQANRCYERFRETAVLSHLRPALVGEPLRSRTVFRNGSLLEIAPGTVKQTSGPHHQKLAFDEVEETTGVVLKQAASIPRSRDRDVFNRPIAPPVPAQWLYASTRHVAGGIMQELYRQFTAQGKPIFIWCWKETVRRCEEECHAFRGGGQCPLWGECGGAAHRSDGFVPLDDVIKTRTRLDDVTWRVQHCCVEPGIAVGGPFGTWDGSLLLPEQPQLLRSVPLWVACDFNVDPMVWEIAQPRADLGAPLVWCDELAMRHVTTHLACEALIERLSLRDGWRGGVVFYGDATGEGRHTSSVESDWAIVRKYMRTIPARVGYAVPEANPHVADGINVTAWAHGQNPARDRYVAISPSCEFLVGDYKECLYHPGTRIPMDDPAKFPDRWHACKAAWYLLVRKKPELLAGAPAGAKPRPSVGAAMGGVAGRKAGMMGKGQVGYVGRMYGER